MAPPPPPPVYRSAAGEREVRALYAATLAALPFPHQERLVETDSFGAVHVVMAGHRHAPPLLLWHGMAGCAPATLAAFAPLAQRFRIFAPDFPCHAGSRSQPAPLDPATHAHGRWCAEVVECLGLLRRGALPPLHLGICLGAAAVLDLAAVAPHAISGVALVVHPGLHPDSGGPALQARLALQLLLPVLLYRLLPCRFTAWLALRCVCDDPLGEEPWMQSVRVAAQHAAHFPPMPAPPSDAALRAVAAPTLVLTAELDLLCGGGAAAAERARALLPHCQARIFRGGTHFLGAQRLREATRQVESFFQSHGLLPLPAPRPSRRSLGSATAGGKRSSGSSEAAAAAAAANDTAAAGATAARRTGSSEAARAGPVAGASSKGSLAAPSAKGGAATAMTLAAVGTRAAASVALAAFGGA